MSTIEPRHSVMLPIEESGDWSSFLLLIKESRPQEKRNEDSSLDEHGKEVEGDEGVEEGEREGEAESEEDRSIAAMQPWTESQGRFKGPLTTAPKLSEPANESGSEDVWALHNTLKSSNKMSFRKPTSHCSNRL